VAASGSVWLTTKRAHAGRAASVALQRIPTPRDRQGGQRGTCSAPAQREASTKARRRGSRSKGEGACLCGERVDLSRGWLT
jgi:hypothetical protein